MTIRLLFASIRRNLVQKFLAFLTIFLASMLIATMLNITLGIGNEMSEQLRSYGANIVVVPKGSGLSIDVGDVRYEPLRGENYLEEKNLHKIKEIFWRNNITGFAPFLDVRVEISAGNLGEISAKTARISDGNSSEISGEKTARISDGNLSEISAEISDKISSGNAAKTAFLVGTYFDKFIEVHDEDDYHTGVSAIFPFWDITGALPSDESNDSVALGAELAGEISAKAGDTIAINGANFKVTAVVSNAGEFDDKIIAPLSVAQNIANLPGKLERVEVSALTIPEDDLSMRARRNVDELDQIDYDKWYCTAYVSSIAYQIAEDFRGSDARAKTQISDAESAVVGKIQSLMGIVSIISLIVASIGISALMSSDIHRRKREIGLIKALGANSFQIYLLFAFESVVIAIVASLFGCLAGFLVSELIAYSIFGHAIAVALVAVPVTMFFAVVIALLGSLLPMRSVVHLLPAEVLYGRA